MSDAADSSRQSPAGIAPPASAATDDAWLELRRRMPVSQRWAYFDHAAVCPLPEPCRAIIHAWADDMALRGDTTWKTWADRVEEVRGLAAGLVGASPDEIALIRSTTEGITLVAEGFPWREGDNVVVPAAEFPSNLYPWFNLAARGVETRQVANPSGRLEPADVAAACDDRTRIVAASWIDYATGWRNDLDLLAEIAHRRGAYLFVDAIQGLGAFPLDVAATPVDFFAADGHKWLLGPEGAGAFFVRRALLELLRPIGVGWSSVVHAGRFDNTAFELKPTAARYEGGTLPMAGFLGLRESLRLLRQYDPAQIARRVLEITDLACERLRAAGAAVASDRSERRKSGIVAFDWPGNPVALRQHCLRQGVAVACRAGRLRISPHAYNNAADVERLIEALRTAE